MKASVRVLLGATGLAACLVTRTTAWSQTVKGQSTTPATIEDKATKGEAANPNADDVTITAKAQDHGDREVYDLTKAPGAKTGNAADALNTIPGVAVDPSGNVTWHGRNVVVYLNGRPSLMLSGDNRGVALQAMPSAYISTIEVISNPGARYSSGDGAPIININTQRQMPPGLFGTLSAKYNSPSGSFEMAYLGLTQGKLSLTLIGSYLNNGITARYGSEVHAFDATGAVAQSSTFDGEALTRFSGPFLSANLEYDVGVNDVVAAALSYNRIPSESTNLSHSTSKTAGNVVTNRFDQVGTGGFVSENDGVTLNYTHYGQKPDETLKIDASAARTVSDNAFRSTNTYLVSTLPTHTGTLIQSNDRRNDKTKTNVHAEYNTPVGDDQLTVGGEIDVEDNANASHVFGPASSDAGLMVNPLLTDIFQSHQVVSAIYATYQREITPRLTVLVGVRGEALRLTSQDLTYRTEGRINYTRLNPSLFATYVISPAQKLRLSCTHRQQRPEAADLNPHIVYTSDTSVTVGNPDLDPQETDSLEGRYEVTTKALNYTFRAFWRRDDHAIASVLQVIPDPQGLGNIVTSNTRVNWRRQETRGLSASFSKQFANKLMLNLDTTVTRSVLGNPQIAGVRAGTSVDGGLSINYTFKSGDRMSAMYKVTGKSFTGQGSTTGAGQANIQYSHKLTPKIDLDLSINDLFRQTKAVTVIDTPLLQTRLSSTRQSPTFMIGLSRNFMRFSPMAPAP